MRLETAVIFVFVWALSAIAQDSAAPAKQGPPEDAAALEARYKTCAKHYIPAEKCTPEIYQQLKDEQAVPPDPKTAAALGAVKEYRSRLKNPDSIQIHTAYVTDKGAVCLEIAGQNSMGGMSVSRVVYFPAMNKGKGKWMDESGFIGGMMASDHSGNYQVDRWGGACYKDKVFGKQGDLYPGTDVTDKVNQVLKAEK